MTLQAIVAYWRDECGFGVKALIAVFAGALLMLFAHITGFYSVELPGGFKLLGAPSQVTKDPNTTAISGVPQSYKTEGLLTNASGVDWVEAKCPEPDERAISGLCVINSEEGWGWLLQNAGVTGTRTWGCAYRRSVYVEGGRPDGPQGKFNLKDVPLPYDVRGAAVTAKATATVLCLNRQ